MLLLGLVLSGCGVEPAPWWSQLEPAGACYEVDLLDGLDEADDGEIEALFSCLDGQGHLYPLRSAWSSLQTPTRSGRSGKVELAGLYNELLRGERDPWGFVQVGLEVVQDDQALDLVRDLATEAVFLEAPDLPLGSSLATEGPLLQVLPELGPTATHLLVNASLDAVWFGQVLQSADPPRWIDWIEALTLSEDPALSRAVSGLLPDLGLALDPDRPARRGGPEPWRSFLDAWWMGDQPLLAEVQAEAQAILGDPLLRSQAAPLVASWDQAGVLAPLGPQLAWMATVDAQGRPLLRDTDEPSALFRFLRLVDQANEPFQCSLDLVLFDIELLSVDNLAVAVLRVLAALDPNTVDQGLDLFALLFDDGLSEAALRAAVSAADGVCPSLEGSLLDDLEAIEVLGEPEADQLLVVVVEGLRFFRDGERDHLPEVANLLAQVARSPAWGPTEALIRDVGPSPLLQDVVALVPVLADPSALPVERPPDLAEVLELLAWCVEVDPGTGKAGWERWRALLAPLLGSDRTWRAVDSTGALLRDPSSRAARLASDLPVLLALDPDRTLPGQVGIWLEDPALFEPTLRIAEQPAVLAALATPSPDGALVGMSVWMLDGTLDALLRTIQALLDALAPSGTSATASISTATPRGSPATATVARAGRQSPSQAP